MTWDALNSYAVFRRFIFQFDAFARAEDNVFLFGSVEIAAEFVDGRPKNGYKAKGGGVIFLRAVAFAIQYGVEDSGASGACKVPF